MLQYRGELVQKLSGFTGTLKIRIRNNLNQSYTGTVVVNKGLSRRLNSPVVAELRRILLKLHPTDPDPLSAVKSDVTVCCKGDTASPIVLRYLEVLRHIRVEVVLPEEQHPLRDLEVEGKSNHCSMSNGLPVQNRQRPGSTDADWADVGVRRLTAVI